MARPSVGIQKGLGVARPSGELAKESQAPKGLGHLNSEYYKNSPEKNSNQGECPKIIRFENQLNSFLVSSV